MLNALKVFNFEIVFVTDKCMDGTVERMRKYGEFGVKAIEKNWKKWANSYSESLQIGYLKAKREFDARIEKTTRRNLRKNRKSNKRGF
jgi:hypothetical protein